MKSSCVPSNWDLVDRIFPKTSVRRMSCWVIRLGLWEENSSDYESRPLAKAKLGYGSLIFRFPYIQYPSLHLIVYSHCKIASVGIGKRCSDGQRYCHHHHHLHRWDKCRPVQQGKRWVELGPIQPQVALHGRHSNISRMQIWSVSDEYQHLGPHCFVQGVESVVAAAFAGRSVNRVPIVLGF